MTTIVAPCRRVLAGSMNKKDFPAPVGCTTNKSVSSLRHRVIAIACSVDLKPALVFPRNLCRSESKFAETFAPVPRADVRFGVKCLSTLKIFTLREEKPEGATGDAERRARDEGPEGTASDEGPEGATRDIGRTASDEGPEGAAREE